MTGLEYLIETLVEQSDPVTATLLVLLVYYTRQIKNELRREISRVRERVERLEGNYIGGEEPPASVFRDYPVRDRGHTGVTPGDGGRETVEDVNADAEDDDREMDGDGGATEGDC